MFNKTWFAKNQKLLLWFANSFIGRWILCLKTSSVGKNKIIKIEPNSITWIDKKQNKFATEFRTHDKFGKRLYYAFYPLWYLFHLWDMGFANSFKPAYNLGFDTLTKYPDAHTESASVDGNVTNDVADNNTWASIHDATAGTSADDTSANTYACLIVAGGGANTFNVCIRSFFLFDTSALTSSASISATTFSYWPPTGTYGGQNNLRNDLGGANSESVNIVSSNPASNTALVVEDFDQFGTTVFSTAKNISTGHTLDQYNDYTFNADGLASVSKTSISKYAVMLSRDIANTPQTSAGGNAMAILGAYFADQTGTDNDPKLVVTYTLPSGFFAIL